MMVRPTCFAMFALLTSVLPAMAQTPGRPGSLTLMSRPSGASFRIEGDVMVVGRTPMTFDRGLSGRYRLSGYEIGYERWKRDIVLDGMTADTVWFTLRQKSAFMAGIRSLVIPGWGQAYDEHPVRATAFMISGLAAGAGVGVAELVYRDRIKDRDAAELAYQAALGGPEEGAAFSSRAHARNRVEDAHQLRQILIASAGGVVLLSVIEAMASVPRPVGTVLLGAARGVSVSGGGPRASGQPEYAMTLAQVHF